MIDPQILQGRWREIQGKLRAKWGQLTNDDLQWIGGNVEQLVGRIQRKTGALRQSVEEYLSRLAADQQAADQQAAAKSAATSSQGGATQEAPQGAYPVTPPVGPAAAATQAGEQQQAPWKDLLSRAATQRSPAELLAIVFGAGLFAGLVTGWATKTPFGDRR